MTCRIPMKSIGCHGPASGGEYPFGLEPEVAADGWRCKTLARLPGWCAERDLRQLAVYLPFGSKWTPNGEDGRGGKFLEDTWQRAQAAGIKVANPYAISEWIGDMNSDADCVPHFYLPALPRADRITLSQWLLKVQDQSLGWIDQALRDGRRFGLCFDVLGACGKPADPARHYLYALVESLTRRGAIDVGVEPCGERETQWHEFPNIYGWMTSEYALQHEASGSTFFDGEAWNGKTRDVWLNMWPDHMSHERRWMMRNGYKILTPTHVWDERVAADQAMTVPQ